MSWKKRLAQVFRNNASPPNPRRGSSQTPRTRRVAVEPLEERRLLAAESTFDFGDGTIGFAELLDLDLSGDPLTYSVTAEHGGILTMEATFDGADGDATLRMEDSDGNLLGEVTGSDGHLRIDHPETLSGTTYELQISGTNSSVDLRLCNLVSQSDNSVEIYDTEGNDTFFFTAATPFSLTTNGVEYQFDDANSFIFHSSSGEDVIEMEDSDGDDTLTASPTQITLASTVPDANSYTATAENFSYAHGYARNGGTDSAEFVGSEQWNRVKVYPDQVRMMGAEYYQRAKFFESVCVDTLGGVDRVVTFGSDDTDALWAMNNDLRIDYAVELESGETPSFDTLDYDVTVVGAEFVVARGSSEDWVQLHDTALNDVFIAKPHKVEMMNGPRAAKGIERGDLYRIVARGFRNVSAIADQGGEEDVAKLYDTSTDGIDVWAAGYRDGETWSTMSSPTRLLYEVLAFEQVGGYGFNGGLGESHGTNRKDHADDVDFVFQWGYWEGDPAITPGASTSGAATSGASILDALASGRSYGRGHTGR